MKPDLKDIATTLSFIAVLCVAPIGCGESSGSDAVAGSSETTGQSGSAAAAEEDLDSGLTVAWNDQRVVADTSLRAWVNTEGDASELSLMAGFVNAARATSGDTGQARSSFGMLSTNVIYGGPATGELPLEPAASMNDAKPGKASIRINAAPNAGIDETLTSQSGTVHFVTTELKENGREVNKLVANYEGTFAGESGAEVEVSGSFVVAP